MWKINEIEAESKLEEWSSAIRDLDSNRVRENHTQIQKEEKLTALSKCFLYHHPDGSITSY